MNWKRFLCYLGIHWSGQSDVGSRYDATECFVCKHPHVCGVLVRDRNPDAKSARSNRWAAFWRMATIAATLALFAALVGWPVVLLVVTP